MIGTCIVLFFAGRMSWSSDATVRRIFADDPAWQRFLARAATAMAWFVIGRTAGDLVDAAIAFAGGLG
jgi:hypothetical protein